jgi:hypothetical protein
MAAIDRANWKGCKQAMKATPREIISAALAHSYGAGSAFWQAMAVSAVRRSGLGPYPNPWQLALSLGYRLRSVTRSDQFAMLAGNCIEVLWEPNARETGLHVFVGDALALVRESGRAATRTDVFRLAGFLALPDRNVAADEAARLQPFVPEWFIEARRQSGSGTYLAIGAAKGA